MRRSFFIVTFLFCFLANAQESSNYKAVAQKILENYNGMNYDQIFYMFNADMQNSLPKVATRDFFSNSVHGIFGDMEKIQFIELSNGRHLYLATFKKGVADILISLDTTNRINSLYISPPKRATSSLERNLTKLILPFKEEWFVYWGGTTEDVNYHVAEDTQKYAFDMLMVKDGKSYEGDPLKNESYFVFGKDIIAPSNAAVVSVINGVYDNTPGELNPDQLTGNTIVLETANQEFLLFGHLKQGSIVVEKGQIVERGMKIAECGNSGNSTEPHLHLSLQSNERMENSKGVKLFFDEILVNGEVKRDYLPIKEDLVQNIKTQN